MNNSSAVHRRCAASRFPGLYTNLVLVFGSVFGGGLMLAHGSKKEKEKEKKKV
jgi:hypothetical protein